MRNNSTPHAGWVHFGYSHADLGLDLLAGVIPGLCSEQQSLARSPGDQEPDSAGLQDQEFVRRL